MPITPARAQAIRTLFQQVPNQSLAAVVVITYMIGTAWSFSSRPAIIAWGAAVSTTAAIRYVMSRRLVRRPPPDSELMRWAHRYTALHVVIGLLWGLSFLLFAHFDQPITVALTMCCLYSVGAGSTSSHAYYPPSLYVLVVPVFVAVLVKTFASLQFGWMLMGAASMLYCGFVIQVCRTQARTLDEGFRYRFENAALVKALTVEKAEAESARQSAEQASLAKSQFLAAASHDLRQPLYALGLFSTALEDMRLDAAGRNVARKIQDSIGAMEKLFEGLLDLSKLEAGVIEPRFEPISVDAVFDRLTQIFLPLALDRGIELRLRSDGEWAWSDAVLLEQVLANLVSNAVRWTRKGGVLLAVRRRRGALRFEVWDTGVGIDAAQLDRIFEDYVQLQNPERDRRRGLGLGLSIARRSIALLGSRIEVGSRQGRGSVFAFVQPEAMAAGSGIAARDRAQLLPAIARRADLPVLVVEDDEDVRLALTTLLARWGVAVEAAASGDAALERFAAGGRYGLLLVDYRLAGSLNGIELIDRLRAMLAEVPPAVLITGEADPHMLRPAAGPPVPILSKPVSREQLRLLLGLSDAETPRSASGAAPG